ncbi:multidrug resistance-associated protein [Penicillium malachiteum]|uniref:multidrug resistance-associated protein n=1 Tax=Penicillium malachiteum TaxID=1324776 RepID=UPI002546E074|nr:multidrug resistance-associated protein [Penicillium malachiteum]KAJ5728595.1 multidrug resistance-associated protein [Penicillium malachiteum]
MAVCESDRLFGPRVDPQCRNFDFTLTFEDGFFHLLPSSLFLIIFPVWFFLSRKELKKSRSNQLVILKAATIGILLVFQLIFVVFRSHNNELHTALSRPADVISLVAVSICLLACYWEDQYGIRPSIMLTLYWSTLAILQLPRLRTLWLIGEKISPIPVLWTLVFITTVAALSAELIPKKRFLYTKYQNTTREERSDVWSWALFLWILPFLRVGFSQILGIKDLPPIDAPLQATETLVGLRAGWESIKKRHSSHILLRATFRAYLVPYLTAIIPRLCLTVFTFCQSFLITQAVSYFEQSDLSDSVNIGHALVGAYALVYLGYALSTAIYWRQTFRFVTMVRGGLISILQQKTTQVKAIDLQDRAALTLMGTDVERIITGFRSIHELWASPIEVGIAIWLLARQVGVASVVPAVLAMLCLLVTTRISTMSKSSQKRWIERVETRLELTTIMLSNMKAVKMLGLSETLRNLVDSLRKVELQTSRKFRKLLIWQIFLSNFPVDIAPMATFLLFSIIALVKGDSTLLSTQAFTSLSLISLMTTPLQKFIQALPSTYQCLGCFERIEAFCLMNPHENDAEESGFSNLGDSTHLQTLSNAQQSTIIECNATDFAWSKHAKPILKNVNISIPRSKVTMVAGSISSGKSTLIASILGETEMLSGSVSRHFSQAAYCAQSPWIMNASIRMNITNTSQGVDEKWYQYSIWASAFDNDIKTLPGNHNFKAGSGGVALSGGQRQRLALARAVYSRQPIVVLDDVASGLDSRTTALISARLFGQGGYFRQHRITVVLATHSRQLLSQADNVILLDVGKIQFQGQYSDLPPNFNLEIVSDLETVLPVNENVDQSMGAASVHQNASIRAEKSEELIHIPDMQMEEIFTDDDSELDTASVSDESRRKGTWSVYQYYCRSAGYLLCITFVIFLGVNALTTNIPTLWVDWWSAANEKHPNQQIGMYLGVYAMLSVVAVVSLTIASWALIIGMVTNTALTLHSDILKTTVQAPFGFLRTMDTGKLTNRFSQDMDLIDMKLPIISINAFSECANCVAKLVILCAVSKYLSVVVPPLLAVIYAIQRCYLRTSRQVRLLDIEARSPLFTHFLETIQGAATIRAFGWQPQNQDRGKSLLNDSQHPVYALYCVQQWLALVLDLTIAAVAVTVVATTTALRDQFTPGSIGVALNMVFTFSQSLNYMIQYWTQTEISIGAVARVERFVQETPSEEREIPTRTLEPGWPSQGQIQFKNVKVQTGDDDRVILDNISLSINPGEKIAICGPSGSGKTSFILALLQMIELKDGSIQIDGQNLAELQPQEITSRLNVIPQEPFIMPGTIRFNLDPTNSSNENTFKNVLQRIGLADRIEEMGGLDSSISISAWSVGELQLLSLARAMIKHSSILILDEAMSSVDMETERLMQEIIDRHFSGQTVLSVVHRLAYIHRFDRVLVLKKGQIVEWDTPKALLSRESELRKLYDAYQ